MSRKVTRSSPLLNTVRLSNRIKVKSDSRENYASVLHPRTSFWGVNICREGEGGGGWREEERKREKELDMERKSNVEKNYSLALPRIWQIKSRKF